VTRVVANLFNRLLFAAVLAAGLLVTVWTGQQFRAAKPAQFPVRPMTGRPGVYFGPTAQEAVKMLGGDPTMMEEGLP
jgi:hypothetical protein